MRVVGGELKGRKLKTFKGSAIRPTTDKVREAVFNILSPLLPVTRALDLYAGTGAMGIEALSRGVKELFFVDTSPRAVSVIKDNLETLGLDSKTRVYKKDVKSAINSFSENGVLFDLIFIDPPYEAGLLMGTLGLIAGKNDSDSILNPGGVIVTESSKRDPIDKESVPKSLELIDSRRYGDNQINIFRLID
ncbi:MAG: 16S rRNA (guanine(966)-N(2))-methyltransferase RsmD [Thermodesulfobacteriota bacterium]